MSDESNEIARLRVELDAAVRDMQRAMKERNDETLKNVKLREENESLKKSCHELALEVADIRGCLSQAEAPLAEAQMQLRDARALARILAEAMRDGDGPTNARKAIIAAVCMEKALSYEAGE